MIIAFEDLPEIRKENESKKIAFGCGTFDLMHYSHVAYVQDLKKFGEVSVVMVDCDERVTARKGPSRPVIPSADRLRIVDAIKGVDYVLACPEHLRSQSRKVLMDAVLGALQPDVFYTTNSDWENFDILPGVKKVIGVRGTDARYESTTEIIAKVRQGGA
jgi:cytidyltransferase-like protein